MGLLPPSTTWHVTKWEIVNKVRYQINFPLKVEVNLNEKKTLETIRVVSVGNMDTDGREGFQWTPIKGSENYTIRQY